MNTKNLGRVQYAQSSEHRGRDSEALAKPHRAERSAFLDLLRVSYFKESYDLREKSQRGETQQQPAHRAPDADRQRTTNRRSPNLCQQGRTFLTYSGYRYSACRGTPRLRRLSHRTGCHAGKNYLMGFEHVSAPPRSEPSSDHRPTHPSHAKHSTRLY